ncbi:MAG: tRNA lysidine(34) synthetase TilS [Propionibacteriaceae bacterium]|nr:tRNA lysidine(34) synthetase TilS [Propionibacteriaceae bacterium]
MARRELGPAALRVARAVALRLPAGPVLVGVSGGADSLALALGAAWAAPRSGAQVRCVVVDHGLQPGSAEVADGVAATLRERGLRAEVRRVTVTDGGGLEAAAREARLAALTRDGHPVLLGHTLDDQAETVLLGLLRGSGLRSLAGMAPVRGLLRRPLLGLRRADTEAACRDWGVDWWRDPMNQDPRFARVRARAALALLDDQLGRDLAVALARTARLAAADADYLDSLAVAARAQLADGDALDVAGLTDLPEALRGRVLLAWLRELGAAEQVHVDAVTALVDVWHGQGPVAVPGGSVRRIAGQLIRDA